MARRNGAIMVDGGRAYRAGSYRLLLDALLARIACTAIEREYRLLPPRRWRADLAWPAHRVALELQGGAHTRGHHTRGRGYEDDCEKMLTATVAGWRIIPITWPMIARRPQEIAEALNEILRCDDPAHR